MKKSKLFLVLVLVFTLFAAGCGTDLYSSTAAGTKKQTESVPKTKKSKEPTQEATKSQWEINYEASKSEEIYKDLFEEIEKDFPEIDVKYVVNGTMTLYIDLQENKDATYRILAELSVKKETLMKNNGIKEIMCYVENKGETEGIIKFRDEGGEYVPVLNTL